MEILSRCTHQLVRAIPRTPSRVLSLCTSCCHRDASSNHRTLHTTSRISAVKSQVPEEYKNVDFSVFYQFPYIRTARLICRLKLYQTGLTVVGVPAMYQMYSVGLANLIQVQAAAGIATFAGVMLYVMGNFLRKVIGMMAISETQDVIRISRLTFWGNRRDVYVPVEDVQPFGDYLVNSSDAYIELKRYTTDDVLFMSLRFGGIRNRQQFIDVFGEG